MREFRIAVFPGDGIGREVMSPCLTLLDIAVARVGGFRLAIDVHEAGADLYRRTGIALPDAAMRAAESADAILLGAMGLPDVRYPDGTEVQPHLDFRERFELYAGVRPFRLFKGAPTPLADPRATDDRLRAGSRVDRRTVRRTQMTRREGNDAVFDTMRITRRTSERLFDFAFALARSRARREAGRAA